MGAAFAVDAGEGGGAEGDGDGGGEVEGFAGSLGDEEFVGVFDFDAAAADPACPDFDEIVVEDGAAVLHVEFGDDEEYAVAFEVGVGDAAGAEEFGSADFEPGDVCGVVGDAHGVALAVADADAVDAGGCGSGGGGWDRRRGRRGWHWGWRGMAAAGVVGEGRA